MPLDLDNYEPYPPMPSYSQIYKLYRTEIVPLPVTDPEAPREYYWHLYYKGEKVNGGIAENTERAKSLASLYKSQHQRNEFHRVYTWDQETARWYIRMSER